jgi:hypothetical protein
MKNLVFKMAVAISCVLVMTGTSIQSALAASDHDDVVRFTANASTFQEVVPKGNGAHGRFVSTLSEDGTTLNWTFTWEGLTGPPLFAHIHFAMRGVNGGIMTFLCGGPNGNPDVPAKPACPQTTSGTITGSTTAADIIALTTPGPTDQAVPLHDFATFLRTIRVGDSYVNMHTTRFPGGEIRGQLSRGHNDDDDDD